MTPNERNLDALYDFLDEKIKQLNKIRNNVGYLHHLKSSSITTSDKLQIRKLRLKK